MSIDLEWSRLDPSLAIHLADVLNRQLTSAERPSFIGPVEVTSLDFGSDAPDVELVDLRDIYRDFLEDDDEDEKGPSESAEDDEGYEWVSRRAAGRAEGLAYQYLPPHVRYGRGGPSDMFASIPPPVHSPVPTDIWSSGLGPRSSSFTDFKPQLNSWSHPSIHRSPSPATPFTFGLPRGEGLPNYQEGVQESGLHVPSTRQDTTTDRSALHSTEPHEQLPPQNPHPNLQLHLHVNWHSNLRITLSTSLLINYPSPMFMSLPIKLSVTGLIFNGEVAVAYEGERRRIHLCILDDLDPYGPASDRPKRDSTSSTPPELDEESSPSGGVPTRPSKPLPVGQRLLPSIYIESEIGQADKHVLKNVTRVERFVQDVIRKTVEEELVFPNFHTLVMGDQ